MQPSEHFTRAMIEKALPPGAQQLGRITEAYAYSTRSFLKGIGMQLLVFFVGTALIAAATSVYLGILKLGLREWMVYLSGWGIGPFMFFYGIYAFVKVILNRNERFFLFEEGFARIERTGTTFGRWLDVDAIFVSIVTTVHEGMVRHTDYLYTLRLKDGKALRLDSNIDYLDGIDRLGDSLAREIARAHLPGALKRYDCGETLDFGPLTLSRSGIGKKSEVVPWGEIKEVGIVNGSFCVKKTGDWLRWADVEAAKIPNFGVFQGVVQHALSQPAIARGA